MSLPNELKFLEKITSRFYYQPSLSGLLRVVCWTALFLLVASIIVPIPKVNVPHQKILQGTQVTSMNTVPGDIRWVRNDFGLFPKDNDNDLNVAWISGSSIVLKDSKKRKELLPHKVNLSMAEKQGGANKTFLYYVSSRRLLDTYTMVHDALERKPDAIVLVINPFWIYNEKAVFFKQTVFNHGAKLWWNEDDWPFQLTLTQPSNHLYNLVGRHIPMITARTDYFNFLDKQSSKLLGLSLKPKQITPVENSKKSTLKLSQPLQFWLLFEAYNGNAEYFFPEGRMDERVWQSAAISQANIDSSSWTDAILRKTLNRIKESKVPALLYVAPLSPEMNDVEALEGYKDVMKGMEALKNEYEEDKFRFIIHMPKDVTESIRHRDYLHLSSPGSLPEFLSKQLSEILSPE